MTQPERFELRAREAVARLLIRRLLVPKVYFEPDWPPERSGTTGRSSRRTDILLIDRSGSGDVHVVEVKYRVANMADVFAQLLQVPAQYRWLAYASENAGEVPPAEALDAPSGMGRIGLIEVAQLPAGNLGASVRAPAERFTGSLRREAAAYVASHDADIEFGGDADPEAPPAGDTIPVRSLLDEAAELRASGHPIAALLIAWTATEAAGRQLATRLGLGVRGEPHMAVVHALRSAGVLAENEFRTWAELRRLRGIVLHELRALPPGELDNAVARLSALAEALLTRGAPSEAAG